MKKGILTTIGLLLLLAACTQKDNDIASMDPAMLRIHSARLGVSFTRADEELTQGSIGVSLQGNDTYTSQTNVPYTYASLSGWSSPTPIYLSAAVAPLAAYYPYSATGVDSEGNCRLGAGLYNQANDLCYACDTLNNVSASWSVNLEHAYALLSLNITRKNSYPGAGVLSRLEIAGEQGVNLSGTLNLFTGEYTDQQAGMIDQPLADGVTLASGDSHRFSFLLVPMESIQGHLNFGVEVDDELLLSVLVPSDYHLSAFSPGKEYVFNLMLNGTSLTLEGVSVRDWTQVSVPGTAVLSPSR